MQIIDEIPVWGDPIDSSAVEQMQKSLKHPSAFRAAIMADHHKGYNSVCVGGVIAYKDAISPSAVGSDIACGNYAVKLDIPHLRVKSTIKDIMKKIFSEISFGVGRTNNERVEHELFDDILFNRKLSRDLGLKDLAVKQLGTVGSGNHYVDIFYDENNEIWVGCHFGSRGVGYRIAEYFIKEVGGMVSDGPDADPVVWDMSSSEAQEYHQYMMLAGKFAYAGREWVCQKVAKILGAEILEDVHNNHNFCWTENIDGEEYNVIRKGCTPASPGQKGFVGGSMGDISVILEGVDSEENKLGLYSTVHGAGRVMGRMQAKGKKKKIKDLSGNWTGEWEVTREGLVTKDEMKEWLKRENVCLVGADVDESPHCYKRLPEVLNHHEKSIKIIHTLTPIGVAMAGEDCHDPYKD